MELEDIELEEIKPFFDSLSEEYQYFRFTPAQLLNTSAFVKGIRVDNTLAGVGGLVRLYGYLLFSFHVVKSEFQRRGFHGKITESLVRFARRKKHHYFLAQVDKGNIASLNAGLKEGYKILYEEKKIYWLYFPLDRWGGMMGKYLLPVMLMFYLSTIGRLLRRLHRAKGSREK